MQRFYSSGKLILMGEYAVLYGADALCMPLKTGQQLIASTENEKVIHWSWVYKDSTIAGFTLDSQSLDLIHHGAGDPQWAQKLIRLIREQNPGFILHEGASLKFENFFPVEWGLGSSSATISSLCRMAGVDPYKVNESLMGGSGADIAATTASSWFLYRRTEHGTVTWELPFDFGFKENTWFVYSGKKQATASHLGSIEKNKNQFVDWNLVNEYVYRFVAVAAVPELLKVVYDHEMLISNAIYMEPVGIGFSDFPGKVKSLGAWGGDFFMAISQQDSNFVKNYFMDKGFVHIFTWEEMTKRESF